MTLYPGLARSLGTSPLEWAIRYTFPGGTLTVEEPTEQLARYWAARPAPGVDLAEVVHRTAADEPWQADAHQPHPVEPVPPAEGPPPRRRRPALLTPDQAHAVALLNAADVRAWARAAGYPVGRQGGIARDALLAYVDAHPTTTLETAA